MTRIVAGSAGGRQLRVPVGRGTRPTSDRVREGLFSTLESLLPGGLLGRRVLDLYAGSGALGLEAVSRGATTATWVETDPRAASVIRANADALDLPGVVVTQPVELFLATAPPVGHDVVLADPPYALGSSEVEAVLRLLVERGWLKKGAVVVVERAGRGHSLGWPPGLAADRERRYGDTVLRYARRS